MNKLGKLCQALLDWGAFTCGCLALALAGYYVTLNVLLDALSGWMDKEIKNIEK